MLPSSSWPSTRLRHSRERMKRERPWEGGDEAPKDEPYQMLAFRKERPRLLCEAEDEHHWAAAQQLLTLLALQLSDATFPG
jgi:hypothetical protein